MNKRIFLLDPSAFTIPYDTHLCRALANSGCEVTLLTRPVRRADYFSSDANTRDKSSVLEYQTCDHFYKTSERLAAVTRLPYASHIFKGLEHTVNMLSLYRSLRSNPPDIIHFQWSVLPLVDRIFVQRLQNLAPCILTVHDTNAFLAPTSRWQKSGWQSVLRIFDHLIVHTRSGKQALIEKEVAEQCISVIPHGVFNQPADAAAAPLNRNSDTLRLLAFGSIKRYKGIDVLLRALAELPEKYASRIRLIIAGNAGALGPQLTELATKLGVADKVDWRLGFVPDDAIPTLFQECDAFVFPYREIDASGALMTALPYGKPIIASKVGLFAELLVDAGTAYLVPPERPAALANAISRLIDNPALSEEMGRRVAGLSNSVLNWQNIAEQTLEAYDLATATNSTRNNKLDTGS